MFSTITCLVLTGCLCITFALALAWTLAGIRYMQLGFLKKIFVNYGYLLKSHIDFLMMTGLIFVFYLMFMQLAVTPPAWVIGAMCIGSVLNPLGFLALAIKPDLPQTPTSLFGALMSGSFTLTTLGYLGGAWMLAHAVLS